MGMPEKLEHLLAVLVPPTVRTAVDLARKVEWRTGDAILAAHQLAELKETPA
jgi:hypothetical protein